jgi:uncharacterized MAPEG superfamily protein
VSLEIQMLGYSALLGLAQIILASHAASFQRGYDWTAGSREEAVAPLTGAAHRFARALANFLETFPLFAALVLAAHVAGREGTLTYWGAHLYFWARLAYVPLRRACCSLADLECRHRGHNFGGHRPVVVRRAMRQQPNRSFKADAVNGAA